MCICIFVYIKYDVRYLHSMVRDKIGRKMSKSLGNVIDPVDVMNGIELQLLQDKLAKGNLDPRELKKAAANQRQEFPEGIPECGADGLRYGLLSYTAQGADIKLDINLVVRKREFCNKLWNVTRFCLNSFDENFVRPTSKADLDATVATGGEFRDAWILSRLAETVKSCNKHFTDYEFGTVCTVMHRFWVGDLCDYYVEMIKPIMYGDDLVKKKAAQATLFTCLEYGLRLLHPIMPFVSEELYHRLPKWTEEVGSIMQASYPTAADTEGWYNKVTEANMKTVQAVAQNSRSTRAGLNLTSTKLHLYISCASEEVFNTISGLTADLALLSQSKACTPLAHDAKKPDGCIHAVVNKDLEIHFPVAGLEELSADVFKRDKKLSALRSAIAKLTEKLAAPGFQKSSEEVKTKMAQKLALQEAEAKVMQGTISELMAMFTPAQSIKYRQAQIEGVEKEIAKVQKLLTKNEANIKKNPKNKKNLKQFADNTAAMEALLKKKADFEAQQ